MAEDILRHIRLPVAAAPVVPVDRAFSATLSQGIQGRQIPEFLPDQVTCFHRIPSFVLLGIYFFETSYLAPFLKSI